MLHTIKMEGTPILECKKTACFNAGRGITPDNIINNIWTLWLKQFFHHCHH